MVYYTEKLSEASRKFSNLKNELSDSQQAETRQISGGGAGTAGSIRRRRSSIHATLLRDKVQNM